MEYRAIQEGIFRERPNRFVAHVEIAGQLEVCHVKNTGRCRELLVPGARVYLEQSDDSARKTRYDLVVVEKARLQGPLLINMDAQAPNKVFQEWALSGGFRGALSLLRPERVYGDSRFDFYWEAGGEKGFVEVKGVTLEENGVACFPDAPTLRGVKHLEGLIAARAAGFQAAVCFVIQMEGMTCMKPNDIAHPEFGAALRRAARAGVEVLAMDCSVTRTSLRLRRSVPVLLEN